jgi:para-nitrobenzyl esterase
VNPDAAAWSDNSTQSEDCLVLNIWAQRGAVKRPVMVWIHGGGYWWGSAGAPIYDGARFAEHESVVFVSLNHRLNAFGFLHLGDLSSEFENAANIGLLDLVEALRWIKRNIEAFGGDPDNVTIFGESGGAMKVSALMAMPAAKGLFSKAIMESGATTRFLAPAEATQTTRRLLDELGLSSADAARLRHVPQDELARAAIQIVEKDGLWDISKLPFGPVLDPGTLPFHPSDSGGIELSARVPAIIGTNADETAWLLALAGAIPEPLDDQELARRIGSHYPDLAEAEISWRIAHRRNEQPGITRQALLVRITSDLWMGDHAVARAETRSRAGSAPSYLYLFDWREPMFGGEWAAHGNEVPFVLSGLDQKHVISNQEDSAAARAKSDPSGTRYDLRDAMMRAWANFARHGRPAAPLLPTWRPFDARNRNMMVFARSPIGVVLDVPSRNFERGRDKLSG